MLPLPVRRHGVLAAGLQTSLRLPPSFPRGRGAWRTLGDDVLCVDVRVPRRALRLWDDSVCELEILSDLARVEVARWA